MAYDSIEEELEAMMNGTHKSDFDENEEYVDPEFENEFDEEEENSGSDTNENDDENNDASQSNDNNAEDTDQDDYELDDLDDDSETNDENDGSDQDTDEADDEDDKDSNEENSQNESDNKDTDTNNQNDDSGKDTAEPNYKDEYEKLKTFYEKVTGEFKANGKTVKGFTDPDRIIQGLQKAIGFEEKNAVINKHKQFLSPLKERGMLEDPAKFNLALSILDGDKEAIKKHLKDLDINPVLDLDLDEIDYKPTQHLASEGKVVLNDALDYAESFGVKDKLNEVLVKDMDDGSFGDFIKYPKLRNDLVEHLQDGTYDLVKTKIDEIRLTDMSGDYKALKMVDQYRYALDTLVKEAEEAKTKEPVTASKSNENATSTNVNTDTKASTKVNADNIVSQAVVLDEKRKQEILAEEEEKFRAEIRNKKAEEGRKAAADISKKKTKIVSKKEEFDPLTLSGDDFKNYFNGLMS